MRLKRSKVIWGIIIVIGLAIVLPIALAIFTFATSGGTGSAETAAELRAVVERIQDPESGVGVDREYTSKRFDDGEWVLSIARDSHAMMSKYWGGGTLVVKDSRGRIRCFFGHVCGPNAIWPYMQQAKSLDEFYLKLVNPGYFTEHQWR